MKQRPVRLHLPRCCARAGVVTCLLGAIMAPASAADGHLDPSFGSDGRVTTAFPGGSFASAVAIQADGKIVAVGAAAGASMTGEFAVARYETDGTLDPTFDGDGMLTTPISGGGDEARSVAIQANGRIVVAGTADGRRFAVVRYMANGALDPTFGGDGIVQTDLSPGGDVAYDIVIQPNRKIVAVGPAFFHRGPRFAVVRYFPNGELDSTFGGDGKVFTGAWAQARAVVLQPNGRIVVGGFGSYGLMLVRYRRSGSLDPTFGTGGVVRRVVQAIFPLAVALQPNGKIVVGGDWDIFHLGLARFTSGGHLDTTFGVDGVVRMGAGGGGEQAIDGLVIQPNGKIVAAGYAGVPHEAGDTSIPRFVVLRFLKRGVLDRSWSGDGRVSTNFVGGGAAAGVARAPDGRIVVVGRAGAHVKFALARYLT